MTKYKHFHYLVIISQSILSIFTKVLSIPTNKFLNFTNNAGPTLIKHSKNKSLYLVAKLGGGEHLNSPPVVDYIFFIQCNFRLLTQTLSRPPSFKQSTPSSRTNMRQLLWREQCMDGERRRQEAQPASHPSDTLAIPPSSRLTPEIPTDVF